MIYDFPAASDPIRQGDVFAQLPLAYVSLRYITADDGGNEPIETDWDHLRRSGSSARIIVEVTPVWAIVISQDCDALRAPDVSLCEIRPFIQVEGKAASAANPRAWMRIITQQAQINQKWFYLPPDSTLGFSEKMGVDFRRTLRFAREELEQYRHLRKGRLNSVAEEHFRERISQFLRRYPCDEWYPLDAPETAAYEREHGTVKRYPWQA